MLSPTFPILGRLLSAPAATPVIDVDDDPATLARLATIMSDRIQPCPRCGGDPHFCRAIGCGPDDAPLLLAQGTVDESGDLDAVSAPIDDVFAAREPDVVSR